MLAAISHEPQKSTTGAFVLTILIQMCRKLLDPAGEKRNLNLRRTGVRVMALDLFDLVILLSLCQHGEMVAYYAISRNRPSCPSQKAAFTGVQSPWRRYSDLRGMHIRPNRRWPIPIQQRMPGPARRKPREVLYSGSTWDRAGWHSLRGWGW